MAVMHDWLQIATDLSHEIKSELHEPMKQQLLLYVSMNYYYFFYSEKLKFTKTTMDALAINKIIMNSNSEDSDLVTMMILMMTLTVRQVIWKLIVTMTLFKLHHLHKHLLLRLQKVKKLNKKNINCIKVLSFITY